MPGVIVDGKDVRAVYAAVAEADSCARADGGRTFTPERIFDELGDSVPRGELPQPDDISASAFLASDEAQHITGVELIVDGGFVNCETFLHTHFGMSAS